MASDKSSVSELHGKKTRKPPVRKPVELAVVVRVTDGSGEPIPDGHVEILQATKDISAAFRAYKQTSGADMVTFTLGEKKQEAQIERQQAAAE